MWRGDRLQLGSLWTSTVAFSALIFIFCKADNRTFFCCLTLQRTERRQPGTMKSIVFAALVAGAFATTCTKKKSSIDWYCVPLICFAVPFISYDHESPLCVGHQRIRREVFPSARETKRVVPMNIAAPWIMTELGRLVRVLSICLPCPLFCVAPFERSLSVSTNTQIAASVG